VRRRRKAADAYEVDDYVRIAVRLKSGTEAWIYVSAMAPRPKSNGRLNAARGIESGLPASATSSWRP